jgi:hypothetical protein
VAGLARHHNSVRAKRQALRQEALASFSTNGDLPSTLAERGRSVALPESFHFVSVRVLADTSEDLWDSVGPARNITADEGLQSGGAAPALRNALARASCAYGRCSDGLD